MSFSCFLMENFIVSILIIIVYILKLIFKNKISCRLSYFIWLTVLGFIMILLLPLPTFDYESIIKENSYICNESVNEEVLYIGESIINDFAENISVWQETFFIKILFYIWVGGVVFSILILIRDPFVGRYDDIALDGISQLADVITCIKNYDWSGKNPDGVVEIITASVRTANHVVQAALLGADIATVPMKALKKCLHHPLTDAGIAAFEADWERVANA